MTLNQAVAMAFPLLVVAAIAAVGLLIVQPWKKSRASGLNERVDLEELKCDQRDLDADLAEADRLIQDARRRIARPNNLKPVS